MMGELLNAPHRKSAGWMRAAHALFVALGTAGTACGQAEPPPTADPSVDSGMTLLEKVAGVVIPNCAVAGCHDSVSETHSMDLSTAQKIYDFWVNQDGFDHCTNSLVKRVIPGDADGSLVVIKITGIAVCTLSQRMPLPPRQKLSQEQIDTIRAWISAGAPLGDATNDAGTTDSSDASSSDDASTDAVADAKDDLTTCGDGPWPDGPLPPYVPDADDTEACTATSPCPTNSQCIGDSCQARWQCLRHFEPSGHPCPTDLATYCGCDGVTFEAPNTCPDRPFQYPGACNEGVNCDPTDLQCTEPEPNCPEGQLPSVVNGHYGGCVPFAQCRCEYHWECPHQEKYRCDYIGRRCTDAPPESR